MLNNFFNNYNTMGEQGLFEDLVIESIRAYGVETHYVVRQEGNLDRILNEDDIPKYEDTYAIEMYLKTVDGWGGEGDFLSKFGLQVRDSVTLVVAKKVFRNGVFNHDSTRPAPQEGDLIWLPFCRKLFEVMFVEPEAVFYQGGALQSYELRCELYEFSNEDMSDAKDILWGIIPDSEDTNEVDSLEELQEIDPIANNKDFHDEEQRIVDFSERDPFSEDIEWVKRND